MSDLKPFITLKKSNELINAFHIEQVSHVALFMLLSARSSVCLTFYPQKGTNR